MLQREHTLHLWVPDDFVPCGMQAAVRVRCACIEARSPHPAAAYATAAVASAAASGTRPQPSWRTGTPLAPPALTLSQLLAGQSTSPAPGSPSSAHERLNLAQDATCPALSSAAAGPGPSYTTLPSHPHSPAPAPAEPASPLLVLFSGGVDSVLLAALAHRALPLDVPIGEAEPLCCTLLPFYQGRLGATPRVDLRHWPLFAPKPGNLNPVGIALGCISPLGPSGFTSTGPPSSPAHPQTWPTCASPAPPAPPLTAWRRATPYWSWRRRAPGGGGVCWR